MNLIDPSDSGVKRRSYEKGARSTSDFTIASSVQRVTGQNTRTTGPSTYRTQYSTPYPLPTISPASWTLVNYGWLPGLNLVLFASQALSVSKHTGSQHLNAFVFGVNPGPTLSLFSTTRLDPDLQSDCRHKLHFAILDAPCTSI